MTWILNNWGKDWHENVVKIIQNLVSIVIDFVRFITDTCFLDGTIPETRRVHRWLSCSA
jgi:hypothetical protein